MWKRASKGCGAALLSVEKNVEYPEAFPQPPSLFFSPQRFFRFSTAACCQLELTLEEIERIVEAI